MCVCVCVRVRVRVCIELIGREGGMCVCVREEEGAINLKQLDEKRTGTS